MIFCSLAFKEKPQQTGQWARRQTSEEKSKKLSGHELHVRFGEASSWQTQGELCHFKAKVSTPGRPKLLS